MTDNAQQLEACQDERHNQPRWGCIWEWIVETVGFALICIGAAVVFLFLAGRVSISYGAETLPAPAAASLQERLDGSPTLEPVNDQTLRDGSRVIDGVYCTAGGYPADAYYGCMGAVTWAPDRPDRRKPGGMGYGIWRHGWRHWVHGTVLPAIDNGKRKPDFFLSSSPGPFWKQGNWGVMCWQSPLHCRDGWPEWAKEPGDLPEIDLQIAYDTWPEVRQFIPPDIPVGQYGGRLNNPEIMDLIAAGKADEALAVCEEVYGFYAETCGFDFVCVDASAGVGGFWRNNDSDTNNQLTDDEHPLSRWFASKAQAGVHGRGAPVFAEAGVSSGAEKGPTRNRLLGPTRLERLGVPYCTLNSNVSNTPLARGGWQPRYAPAKDHACMLMARHTVERYHPILPSVEAGPENARKLYRRGCRFFAIPLNHWAQFQEPGVLPAKRLTPATFADAVYARVPGYPVD